MSQDGGFYTHHKLNGNTPKIVIYSHTPHATVYTVYIDDKLKLILSLDFLSFKWLRYFGNLILVGIFLLDG